MTAAAKFRALVDAEPITIMPGAFDPLSAKLAQANGFEAIQVSGFALSASMGLADVGLTTLAEVADRAARIAAAVDIPIQVDCDTGFGNYLNVMRTVEEMERAGAASILLEDSVTPPNRIGRPLISTEEMVGKIEAAVEARRDPDFFLLIRTDAAPTLGIDEAIARARAYADAGADGVLLLDIDNAADMRKSVAEVGSVASFGVMSNPHPPHLSAAEQEDIGFRATIASVPPLFAAVKAMNELLTVLMRTGSLEGLDDRMAETREVTELLDLPRLRELERKYLGTEDGWHPW